VTSGNEPNESGERPAPWLRPLASPNQIGGVHGGETSMRARGEVAAAVAGRYRAAGRVEQGRILDELCGRREDRSRWRPA
jgi:hypothetical protein